MLMKKTANNGTRLIFPIDVVVTNEVSEKGLVEIVPIESVRLDRKIVDIGPKTMDSFKTILEKHGIVRTVNKDKAEAGAPSQPKTADAPTKPAAKTVK